MYQELVRINSKDNIEQPGILYKPDTDTDRIVIHVHGLNGNFFECRYIDTLAKTYTDNNYAFLTFNNRGRDATSDLFKGNEGIIIGSCYEKFSDCILDIDGVVEWIQEKGFKEIILEGHSYGCNKVLYYYNKKKNNNIKKIILLAPCDIPSLTKRFINDYDYERIKIEATRLVQEEKGKELIDFPFTANGKISAETFYNDYLPGGENDFIKYSSKTNEKNEILNSIEIPVLVVFGDKDYYVLSQPIELVEKYLINNIKDCNVQIIEGGDHLYNELESKLGKIIKENIQ